MPQAHILIVDDEPDIRELVSEILEDEGYTVAVAEDGTSARSAYAREEPDLVLLDIWMPDIDGISLLKEWSGPGLRCPVVIMTGHGSVETAVEATRLGARDFVQKPISLAKLLSIVDSALEHKAQHDEKPRHASTRVIDPVGTSRSMQELRERARQAAQHESPVLITGECGSGREMLARHIHDRSGREGPFVVLDHCAIGAENYQAYLLGGGSEPGLFERAARGSLYIPDIQDLPVAAMKTITQATETAEQGGADHPAPRLIGAGSADLPARAETSPELEQLYFRLNVLPLHIPPLRERPEDVPDLLRYFCEWFPDHEDLPYRPISVSAQNRLRNHSWPGNVRELKNLVQQLLILGGEGEITVDEVEEALSRNPVTPSSQAPAHPEIFDLPLREAREAFERDYLVYQLGRVDGSVGKLAENVGMERTHLYRKLRALKIDPKSVTREGEAS
ncbi:MAG: sigma-54 dependent transcriptional regulator [Xanthomonadales bacterium]|nr:sigma-54 dependent transcriptional regulator [Xanthomonadales bacterium]